MPNTPTWSLPYPSPTDPVAQGAADIRALSEAVDARLTQLQNAHRTSRLYGTMPAIGGALLPVSNLAVAHDDLAALVPPARIRPAAGYGTHFLVTADVWFGGATGSGGVRAELRSYTAADVLRDLHIAASDGGMNSPLSLAGMWTRQALDDYLTLELSAGSTGSGHNADYYVVSVYAVGMPLPAGGISLDELE